jgi:hypothetical protein
MSDLLSTSKLMKLISAGAQFGIKAYTITDLYDDLRNEIWREVVGKTTVDTYRRNLQKMHLTKLIDIVQQKSSGNTVIIQSTFQGRSSFGSAISTANSDILSITKANLKELKRLVSTALPVTSDKMTRYHLQDCLERINDALNPK